MYMTENAAIHIVFTLQGLYTYTHSPRLQPVDNSDWLRGTGLLRTRLTATTPSCPPRLGCILSQEVTLELWGPPLAEQLFKLISNKVDSKDPNKIQIIHTNIGALILN